MHTHLCMYANSVCACVSAAVHHLQTETTLCRAELQWKYHGAPKYTARGLTGSQLLWWRGKTVRHRWLQSGATLEVCQLEETEFDEDIFRKHQCCGPK